jgi:hypothetical protein
MEPRIAARRLIKDQYAAVRQALTLLDEQVLARYWAEDTPVRTGFERFLGQLDETAGRFLDDEELSRRGQDLLRRGTRSGAAPEPGKLPEAPQATALEPPPEHAVVEPPGEPAIAATEADAATPAAEPGTVEVTFTLPADVEADRVALCGEFNEWATDETWLERGGDGSWRVTIALEPGSYRYKYLVDGERWENAPDADRYEPNAFGSIDSIVTVE